MADEDRDTEPRSFEEHLRVYVSDPSLWPVLAVVTLIFGTFGASLLIYALELRNPFALAALAILIVASGHALIGELRERRFGTLAWIVVGLWLASAAVALAAHWSGIF